MENKWIKENGARYTKIKQKKTKQSTANQEKNAALRIEAITITIAFAWYCEQMPIY